MTEPPTKKQRVDWDRAKFRGKALVDWTRARFKGKSLVWVKLPDGHLPSSGTVAMKYKNEPDAKEFSANVGNIVLGGGNAGGSGSSSTRPSDVQDEPERKRKQPASTKASKDAKPTNEQYKATAESLIRSLAAGTTVVGTDGACPGNPGPGGAGASAKLGSTGKQVDKFKALGMHTTNQVAEIEGAALGFTILEEEESKSDAVLLTDSKYVEGLLIFGWKAKANQKLVASLREQFRRIQETRKVTIHWVKGHSGIDCNERADRLANRGVEESRKQAVPQASEAVQASEEKTSGA